MAPRPLPAGGAVASLVALLLALLALAGSASAHGHHAVRSSARTVSPASFAAYHTGAELMEKFRALADDCPALTVSSAGLAGASSSGNSTAPGAVTSLPTLKISTGGRRRVAMLFGEHARELISPETALRLTEVLCGTRGSLQTRMRAKRVLRDFTFLIFPNVNPAGRAMVEQGRYCHRTNGNSVDLNRNWDIGWHAEARREVASGPAAWSESETRIARDAVAAFAPQVFFSVHSGALGMFTPYAYTDAQTIPASAGGGAGALLQKGRDATLRILRGLNSDYCRCGVGAAAAELRYLCPGNCLDYAFEALRTPFSFAFEIWDGQRHANAKSVALVETDAAVDEVVMLEVDSEHQHQHEHEHQHQHQHQGHSCMGAQQEYAPAVEAAAEEAAAAAGGAASFLEVSGSVSASGTPITIPARFPVPTSRAVTDCFTQFNPPTAREYELTVSHWTNAFLAVLDKLPQVDSL